MMPPTIGKYEVRRLLGRGGMAEVYESVHPELGRRVAIKVMLPHLAETAGFEARFCREAQVVASLRHPHIVQLYDFDIVDGRAFMVMEYLDGGTLSGRLQDARLKEDPLSLGEIARLLDPLGAALEYAHKQGIVHRDIKPGNILFTADDQPVLSDFGIARLLADTAQLTASGGIIGSPSYLSPEQAMGQPVSARSDIYSLGVVVYEMATGRVPFAGETPSTVLFKHVQEAPQSPASVYANVPETVADVILIALAKDPALRFDRASEFARSFRSALLGKSYKAADTADADITTQVGLAPSTPHPMEPDAFQLSSDPQQEPPPPSKNQNLAG
ncbi:MAG: serine/threonine protein kinase [Chloroflexi bacterium]|nr:serine/threonine protein kinase [Chloroflexota bacterium]